MTKPDCAVACFDSGFNCAQAVFSTYAEQLGLDAQSALKVSSAFGGGMGHLAEACGAVTGAFMLIGLKHGKYLPDNAASNANAYALAQEFAKRFTALHGSINCKELLGCDMRTPEGLQYARENGLFKSVCPKLVRDAATIIEELLQIVGEASV